MAGYNQPNRGNFRQPQSSSAPAAGTGSASGRPKAILSTGLFAPTKPGVKSLGSVQVKEDVLIPAGSYINLYPSERTKENSPVYKIQVTAGKKKA